MEQKNPWLTIWTEPRATIAQIVKINPNRSLWWLAAIYGLSSLFNLFQSMALGNSVKVIGIVILAIIIAPIYGYISFWIWSGFVYWIGKLFKGQATFKAVRASYAWSCVPIIVNIPLWFLMIGVFGQKVFMSMQDPNQMPAHMFVLLAISIVKVIVFIWALVIFINALSEVQKYSVVRSILNIVLSGVVLGIIFFVLWMLLYASSGVAMSSYLFFKPF